jgi:hypothetical protein
VDMRLRDFRARLIRVLLQKLEQSDRFISTPDATKACALAPDKDNLRRTLTRAIGKSLRFCATRATHASYSTLTPGN